MTSRPPTLPRLAVSPSSLDAQLRVILDTVLDAIVVIDAKGTILSFNRAAEKIFGYPAADILGGNIRALVPEPHRSHHDDYLRRYQETGEATIVGIGREVEAQRRDGTLVPVDLQVTETWIDGERYFTGVLRDLSQRKIAEAALADKNTELEASSRLDQIESAIAQIFAQRTTLSHAFGAVLEVLANGLDSPVSAVWTYDEWSGLLKHVASHAAPVDLQRDFRFGEGVVGQVGKHRRPFTVQGADIVVDIGIGTITPASVIASPLMYQERLLGVFVLAFTKEPTKRTCAFVERLASRLGTLLNNLKQYEDLLELSRQLNARSREIAKKNRELQRANRLKSEFLANMSHELRTPLNAIIGFSEILRDGLLGDLSQEQTEYATEIFEAGRHLLDLINEILDLAKIEAGKMQLRLDLVDIRNLLQTSFGVVRERALAHRLSLELSVDEAIHQAVVDPRKFRQIVYNLLSNAVKFTADGGTVTLAARLLEVGDESMLEVLVRDTGIGIAAPDLERLFRPFEQVDGSMSRRYEGTGLGLAMVERLTTLHGGTVHVESEPGVGSVFAVRLPLRSVLPSSARTPTPSRELPAVVAADAPVVLVAAPETSSNIVEATLRGDGYLTIQVEPDQLVNGIEAERPDLVVLDLSTAADGQELLQQLDQIDVPVVLLGLVGESEGLSLGLTHVLKKPIESRELRRVVSSFGVLTQNGDQPCVLLVDDDPRAVELVGRQLEAVGYQVMRAYGGAEALEMVSERPDLIVLDLMMPDVTGFDVLAHLRVHPETRDIPVIVLTAKVLEPTDRRQLAKGVARVMEKRNFTAEDLLRQVRRATRARATSRPARAGGALASSPTLPSLPAFEAARTKRSVNFVDHTTAATENMVLVVEDNVREREVMRLYLEDGGMNVSAAGNGREALEWLRRNPTPALIILDLTMPEMDGFEVLTHLSDDPRLRDIPVLVATGLGEDARSALVGPTTLLTKPIGRDTLLRMVRRMGVLGSQPETPPRVLIVDDDPNAVRLVESFLENEYLDISVVYDGDDVLDAILAAPPDLVLLDLLLPGCTGFEVLETMRSQPDTRDIPVIVITARTLTEQDREFLVANATAIAHKGDLNRESFLRSVRQILGLEGS